MINKVLIKVRNAGFILNDTFKGSVIRKAIKDIEMIDRLDSTDSKVATYQRNTLNKLLKHATEKTTFYSDFKDKEFDSYPVINKKEITEHQHNFLSNNYSIFELKVMTTSGSTGTPFASYQNIEKKKRVYAEVIYYSGEAGFSVGKNIICLKALTEKNAKKPINQWIQNESLIDISNLDDNRIKNMFKRINVLSKNGSMILAYASTFDTLKDYFDRNGSLKLEMSNITGVISTSEMLSDETRETISNTFKCKVISRYSNQENGIIGQDKNQKNHFIINEANYIVEVFKMEVDELAAEGEVGRIVITDLYNYAMPMIRYDTGDIGSITYTEVEGIKKKVISNFGGRRVDVVFDCYGNRLSPGSVSNSFGSFPEIKQYQFIQDGENEYLIKINVDPSFDRFKDVENQLLDLLGPDAKVKIIKVDEIPIMASGKRKYIINNFK